MKAIHRATAGMLIMLLPMLAVAADFRTVSEQAAVLYDAPSVKSRKLFIVNRGYPLEVVVQVEGWIKVRDAAGALSWIEAKSLDTTRSVLVKTETAVVRQKPAEDAPSAFEVQRDVLLEVVAGQSPAGWLQVKHRDGATGYVRMADVWGG